MTQNEPYSFDPIHLTFFREPPPYNLIVPRVNTMRPLSLLCPHHRRPPLPCRRSSPYHCHMSFLVFLCCPLVMKTDKNGQKIPPSHVFFHQWREQDGKRDKQVYECEQTWMVIQWKRAGTGTIHRDDKFQATLAIQSPTPVFHIALARLHQVTASHRLKATRRQAPTVHRHPVAFPVLSPAPAHTAPCMLSPWTTVPTIP
jgi:hypothetical protein